MDTSSSRINFEKIKNEYSKFDDSFIKEGKHPLRDTKIGFWGCTPLDYVYDFFKKIKLEKYENFLDLGSGDGRVVLIASLFTKASGVEADKELFEKSLEMNNKLKKNAEFINKDFMDMDLSSYDFLYIFPDKPFYMVFEDKLNKEMKGVLAVCNQTYTPTFLKKEQIVQIGHMPFLLFKKG